MEKDALIVVYETDHDTVQYDISPGEHTASCFAAFICSLVSVVAGSFEMNENVLWELIEDERLEPSQEFVNKELRQ